MKIIQSILLFCLLLISVTGFCQDKPILLRYKFDKNVPLRWTVVHRANNCTTMKETTIDTQTYSESEKIWTVKQNNPDGSAVIENSVAWVNLWQNMTGKSRIGFDSRTGEKPSSGYERIASMINVPLAEIELDARGDVIKRKDFFPQTELQLLNPVQLTVPFPENPVDVGETWQVEKILYVPKPGATILKVRTVLNYQLISVEDNIATIRYFTQVLTPIHDPATEAQIVQCHSKGTMKFDLKSGRSIEHVLSLEHSVPHFSGEASIVKHKNRSTETIIE